jgi:hypothetical protein
LDYLSPDLIDDQDAHSFNILVEGAYYPLLSKHLDLGVALTTSYKVFGEFTDQSSAFAWTRAISQFKTKIFGKSFTILATPGVRAWALDFGTDEYLRALNVPIYITLYETPNTATELTYGFEWEPFNDDAFTETIIAPDLFLRTNYSHTFGLAQYFYFLDYLGYGKVGFDIRLVDATNLYDQTAPRIYGALRIPIRIPEEKIKPKMGKNVFFDLITSYEYDDYLHSLQTASFGLQKETLHLYLPEPLWPKNPIQADVKRIDNKVIVHPSLTYNFWGPFSVYLDYQMILNRSSDKFFSYIDHKTSAGVYFAF